MKKKKCGGSDSKSERDAKCIRHSQNLAKQLRKRRAAPAGLSKEQLVNTFLELEAGVAMLEMQVEKVRRAEEEIAEVGEEDYDFFRGKFPMSRFVVFKPYISNYFIQGDCREGEVVPRENHGSEGRECSPDDHDCSCLTPMYSLWTINSSCLKN